MRRGFGSQISFHCCVLWRFVRVSGNEEVIWCRFRSVAVVCGLGGDGCGEWVWVEDEWGVIERGMQRRQHEEEKGKADVGKRVRKHKEQEQQRRQGRVGREGGMWGSWSRVRCIPQPSAVCSSIRTSIAHPIAQVRLCVCVCVCVQFRFSLWF